MLIRDEQDELARVVDVLVRLKAERERCGICNDPLKIGESNPCDDCWPAEVKREEE